MEISSCLLSLIDGGSRQDIEGYKDIEVLNNANNQYHLIDILEWYFNAEYTFFSIAHKTSPSDDMLGHKTNLNTFQQTEITLLRPRCN